MLISLRREYGNLITSGSQLILLLVGLKTESSLGHEFILFVVQSP